MNIVVTGTRGIPNIMGGVETHCEELFPRIAAKAMLRLGEWMGCKFADHVIVISEVIKNLIARQCGRTKNVHLIYNGVPRPQIRDSPEYFEELGIEKGRYILAMCRFVPEKNLHHLVEAFARLKKNDGVKLVLAGDVTTCQLS